MQGRRQLRPDWVGEEPARGLALATAAPGEKGVCIWPARPGSLSTLILLSARPGAGLGNVTFQRKSFPFAPQERKRQKDKQTPRVVEWETGQNTGLRKEPPLPLLQPLCPEMTAIASLSSSWPRTNGFHSLSTEEGACHGLINRDPPLVPAFLPQSQPQLHAGTPSHGWLPGPCPLGSASLR